MEFENTKSNLGLWILKTDVSGYTGSGHLEFTGNTIVSGPATSPLIYTFSITQEGYYRPENPSGDKYIVQQASETVNWNETLAK